MFAIDRRAASQPTGHGVLCTIASDTTVRAIFASQQLPVRLRLVLPQRARILPLRCD